MHPASDSPSRTSAHAREVISWLPLTVILGVLVLGCALAVAAIQTPGFSITTRTLSQLALTPDRTSQLVEAALVFLGATFFPFAFAVRSIQDSGKATWVVAGLLMTTGAAVILIGIAPHSNQQTFLGISALLIHDAATRAGAAGALSAIAVEAYAIRGRPQWIQFHRLSIAALVPIASSGLLLVLNLWPLLAGVFELIIIGPATAWVAWFAVRLCMVRQPGK